MVYLNLNNILRKRFNRNFKSGTIKFQLNNLLTANIRNNIKLTPYVIQYDQLRLDISRAYRKAILLSHQYGVEYKLRLIDSSYNTPVQKLIEAGLEPSLVRSMYNRDDRLDTKVDLENYQYLLKNCSNNYKKLLVAPIELVNSVSDSKLRSVIDDALEQIANTSAMDLNINSLDESMIVEAACDQFCEYFGPVGKIVIPVFPDVDDMLSAINPASNMGAAYEIKNLCRKSTRKEQLVRTITSVFYHCDTEFMYQLSKLPIIVFTRLQFKLATIKTRLVFAVPGQITIIQSFVLKMVVSCMVKTSSSMYCSGLTQIEISSRLSNLRNSLTGSFDAKGFDLSQHRFSMIFMYCILDETIFKNNTIMNNINKFLM